MIPGRGKPLSPELNGMAKFTPVMVFDCRGFEPVEFLFGSSWEAESVSVCILLNFSLSHKLGL